MKLQIIAFILSGIFLLPACSSTKDLTVTSNSENKLVMATLYTYYAAEYKALAYQAFNAGKKRLVETRLNNPEAENLAVVVDIDETVLDNSPYEAKMILDDMSYSSDSWHEWCDLSAAEAVPGALEFLLLADSLNFQVFYLSNRKKKYTQESTMKNLQDLGFPQISADHFLLRDGERSKVVRRNKILENHEIVLLAGDNLGDFYDDSPEIGTRDELMLLNKDNFGEKFLVLPNAMYGEWATELQLSSDPERIKKLLEKMTAVYN